MDDSFFNNSFAYNSNAYRVMKTLKLPDENGVMTNAIELPFQRLRLSCDMKEISDFAYVMAIELANIGDRYQTTTTSDDQLPYSARFILSAIFIIVGCIGLVGNILTVLVIYKTASLHSHTNYFLASLAISDLCLIVVGVPFDLLHLWMRNRSPSIPGYCSFTSTSISLFTFASILTIVSLTAERFVAICYPFNHRSIFDKNRVINLIYIIWVIAFFPSLYIGLQFKLVSNDFCGYNREVSSGKCDYVTSPDSPYPYPFETIMVITFLLPLVFIVYCYVRILATLNEMATATTVHIPIGTTNSDSSQHANPSSPSCLYVHTKNFAPPKSQQAQKMVIKMLVTVSAVFFICYLPYHIERLIVQYIELQKGSPSVLLYSITGLLQYVSATLNPIFYNLMSNRFRAAFSTMVKHCIPTSDHQYSTIARLTARTDLPQTARIDTLRQI